jgi:hypothetical protein
MTVLASHACHVARCAREGEIMLKLSLMSVDDPSICFTQERDVLLLG